MQRLATPNPSIERTPYSQLRWLPVAAHVKVGSRQTQPGALMVDEVLRGSCLCGAVTYEVRAPFLRFAHCFCSRCRKATGSSHAANLYISPDHLAWTSDQDSVVRFDLPSAQSFATTFCRNCGAPLPHHTRSGREVVVPAGSLDNVPSLKPQANIFWSSRAPWACGSAALPNFDKYTDNWRA